MAQHTYTVGNRHAGFLIRRVVPLDELNATLVELRHERTGARYLHLASADDNNLFAVGFRTPPRDSKGTPHILEHTVLCGSERYPVRDPFFSMLKRSLSTFMNALTADDWTLYPFSSQNRADYYNLLGVYLDAVFFPLLRERDFGQEGHRLEFAEPADPNAPLQIKGVVYNEMKGHMSDPHSLLAARLAETLYPTSPYGRNAGGEPAEIPNLTWEELRAFHAECYHPSNAYFFSYGHLPLEPHLEQIEDLALRRFEQRDVHTEVPREARFDAPRRVTAAYPLDSGESLERKAMVQVGWLNCDIGASTERLALGLLSTLLLGNPAAPLYRALLESKLGGNLAPGSGYGAENRDTMFAVGLQGTEAAHTDAIESLILTVLQQAATEGFARDKIDAAIHQIEFAHREVRGDHYPYALGLLSRVMGPWIHGGDPVAPLLLTRDLERLREEIDRGTFFQDLIRRQLLENPHRVTLTLVPDAELRKREDAALEDGLEARRRELSAEEAHRLVHRAQELLQAQETEDDPSVLPTLEVEDIPRREQFPDGSVTTLAGAELHQFAQPTNGIGYLRAHFPLSAVGEEDLPLLPLLCSLLTKLGAAGQPYTTLAERVAAGTGGVHAALSLLESPEGPDRYRPLLEIGGKALERNRDRLFEIWHDFLTAPEFGDRERIHTVLNQIRVGLDNSLTSMGHRYAGRLAAASLSPAARLRECWSGIEHLRLVRRLADTPAAGLAEFADRLSRLAATLLRPVPEACCLVAEQGAMGSFTASLETLLGAQQGGRGEEVPGTFCGPLPEGPARLGLITSVPVAYVARVYPCVPYTHPDAPGLVVLAKLLRSCYLHREIREKGGAYGGYASYSVESGMFSMLSYRDPNLVRTLRVYDDAARWATKGEFGQSELREALLGVFSDLDTPLSPGGKGLHEFANLRQGLDREMRQQMRDGLLATDRATLVELAERYLVGGAEASAVAVVAGEDALAAANRELGDEPLRLERV